MPLYDFRCPAGHTVEQLRRYEDRDAPVVCACGAPAVRILSAHHAQPDGIYSYAPNIGSAETFERARAQKGA